MSEEKYRHVYVVIEHIDGKLLPVSLEMLGEARRLFDDYNTRYSSNEKVVAIILGNNIKNFSKELIEYGADAVVCADHPELKDLRNTIHTKVISQIALDKEIISKIDQIMPNNSKNHVTYFLQQTALVGIYRLPY